MATATTASFAEWQSASHHPGAPALPGPVLDDVDDEDSSLEATYIGLIEQSLHTHMVDNALFLSERFIAEFPSSPQAVYWLALCHFRNGNLKASQHVLERTHHPQPHNNNDNDDIVAQREYLLALCCYKLKDYSRAEECLLREARIAFKDVQQQQLGTHNKTSGTLDDWVIQSCRNDKENQTCLVPNGAAGVCLLGQIFLASNRKPRAIQYFQASLCLDPFLWTSMEALAELGALEVEADSGAQPSVPNNATTATPAPTLRFASTPTSPQGGTMQTPGLTPIQPTGSVSRFQAAAETPGPSFLAGRVPQPAFETPAAPSRATQEDSDDPPFSSMGGGADEERKERDPTEEEEEERTEKMATTAPPKNAAALERVLSLLQTAAVFYQHVCQYRSKEGLQTMQQLSRTQQETGWVLHQTGRAHLDMNAFTAAQRCLEQMQAVDPCRLEGLEILSTVYWHLKKEVELSRLSQQALAMSRRSAITWCVVGNCFSLQKDHETALVFFRRALQINPNFAYVHTLSGYEYMSNEDFDKAIDCFRQALRTNDRHYNAWYGLGAIFHRQEKYDFSEYHFEKAVSLHPMSSILLCNLGIAQYANGKAYQALDTLAQAFRLDPTNPQARFQRASIYAALHRPAEALAELLKVRDCAPREAAVHFAMGKVLKRLGRPQEAITSFLTAMDLDPKDNQIIKTAMDKIGEDSLEESASTF